MRLKIQIKTGKNESKVINKDFGEYEVWVKAPPIDGRANKELVKVLADYFSVRPNNLFIVKGLTSPIKIIELKE